MPDNAIKLHMVSASANFLHPIAENRRRLEGENFAMGRRFSFAAVFALVWICFALLGGLCLEAAASDDASAGPSSLVGSRVNVELRSGKIMKSVLVAEATPGETPGTITKLRVVNMTTRAQSVLGASAIDRVVAGDGGDSFVFDETLKVLVSSDPEKREAARKASAAKKPAPHVEEEEESEAHSEEPVESDAERAKRRHQDEQKRLRFYKKTGIWLWPELTDADQKKEVARQRDYVQKVIEKFPSLKMRLHETDHFLFLTDLPSSVVDPCIANLDTMFSGLCKAFGVRGKSRDRLLLGKAIVIAFNNRENLQEFEKIFFPGVPTLTSAQGLAHMMSSGEVLISCFYTNDPNYFSHLLVHETTHGFIHRYKAYRALPNWLDEGIAEWMGMNVVKNNHGIKLKKEQAMARMRREKNLGGNFFTVSNIHGEQYGMATLLVEYMLRTNRKGFRDLILDIKSGTAWQEALRNSYGISPEELTKQFGESIGIPDLKP